MKKFLIVLVLIIAFVLGIILGVEIVQIAKELMRHHNGW